MAGAHADSLTAPLVGADAEHVVTLDQKDVEPCCGIHWHPDATFWRVLHAVAFVIGGTTFLAGGAFIRTSRMCRSVINTVTIARLGEIVIDVQL
jgi:hypothetical protein